MPEATTASTASAVSTTTSANASSNDLPPARTTVTDEEKDFILFLDEKGQFTGDYESPMEEEGEGEEASRQDGINNPQSAINEETGEINWDCPCLQSALAPPCGEFFREAFSCFVASKTEPKGSDCLEKFASMQNCFRDHPEVYLKHSLEDDDNDMDRMNKEKGEENITLEKEPADSFANVQSERQPPSSSSSLEAEEEVPPPS